MTEKEIEAYFVKRVKALGGYSYKFRSITLRGVSDRIACLPNGVIVRDDGGADDGEFRHSMSTEDPRCDAYPLAQTMAYITTKYPK